MMFDDELATFASETVRQFADAKFRIASAESCTGGLIGACITSVSGSSAVFDYGFITYSNEAKTSMLGVPADLIEQHGAVSPQVASEMAIGAIRNSNADAAVAVTGIAGPGGATESKPVGLVYIAVATRADDGAFVEDFNFGEIGRDEVRRETVKEALEMLLAYGLDDEPDVTTA
jgi:nicotinamide-nucleotide amidase